MIGCSQQSLYHACDALSRVTTRLFYVECAVSRKKTPGRVKEIDNGDSLDCFDAHDINCATAWGIPLMEIVNTARRRIDDLLEKWN